MIAAVVGKLPRPPQPWRGALPATHARRPGSPSIFPKVRPSRRVTFSPTPHPHKSFTSNTYKPPRNCCKQKTYRKSNSFRCNTYKKTGGGAASQFFLRHQIPRAPVFSFTYELPIFYPLCFDIHACNGGVYPPPFFFVPDVRTSQRSDVRRSKHLPHRSIAPPKEDAILATA
jgi:hypothetical protein